MTQLSFDATQVAPQESPAPIPAGVYLAQVVESDVNDLKSGQGRALALKFQVLSGPFANRHVFTNLNIEHRGSAEAQRIAQSQLSALCHAVGVLRMQDSTQLHMRPVMIRVKIRKDASGQYPDRNEVTGYEAAQAGGVPQQRPGFPPPAAAMAQQPAPSPTPPLNTGAVPPAAAAPWARRPATAQA